MKTRQTFIYGILAVIFALAFITCKNEPAHIHEWEWTVTTPATCIATGEESGVCKIDPSHTTTREIPIDPDGHDWGEWVGTVTCTTAGTGRRVCLLNSEHIENEDEIPALGHNYVWKITTAPTCITAGVETGTCTRDLTHTDTREKAIDPNAHDWDDREIITPATCTVAGEETAECKLCGAKDNHHPIPINPDAHDWNTEKEVIAATETTNGIKAITCKHNKTHTKEEEFSGEYATGTNGLEFVLISSNTRYRVSRGTATGAIYIPAYRLYNGNYLPVTEVGNGANSITNNAFGGSLGSPNTTVTSVTFAAESQLTTISSNAFYYCTGLTSITIPAGVTTISIGTFSGCTGLTGITIPASVTSIGGFASPPYGAFYGCTNLTSITFAEGSQLTTIGVYAFRDCTGLTGITIPAGVTSIGERAFYGCTGLTGITIPAGVTYISMYAFYGWTASQTINIEGHASQASANAAWGTMWRSGCNAVINYLGSSGG